MEKKNLKGKIFVALAALVLAMVTLSVALKTAFFSNNNVEIAKVEKAVENTDGRTIIEPNEIIAKACELLGKRYIGGSGSGQNGKGTKQGNPWTINANIVFQEADEVQGIDCSGLIYWTLGSLKYKTSGFSLNNPVPVDTFHWLTYMDKSSQYWKEIKDVYGAKSFDDIKPTINGKSIVALKKEEAIEDNLRYYQYKDENGEIRDLPAGTIIVANAVSYNNVQKLDDHAWITLGNYNSADEVKQALKAMGVDENLLNDSNVVEYDNGCTYWRIESAGGRGVYINNGDPDRTYTEFVNGTNKIKAIGPIWAFKITDELDGDYKLNINKVNENGNPINYNENNSSNNVFEVTKNDEKIEPSEYNNSGIAINSNSLRDYNLNHIDTYIIEEKNAPEGYVKYNNKIKVEVKTVYDNDSNATKKTGIISKVTIINENGNVIEEKTGFTNNTTAKLDSGKVTVQYEKSTGAINVYVENKKLEGSYDLEIVKTNERNVNISGSEFKAEKIELNGNSLNGNWSEVSLNEDDGFFSVSNNSKDMFEIKNTEVVDVIRIEETKIPSGYAGYNKQVVLQVFKTTTDNKYVVDHINVFAFNKDEEITAEKLTTSNANFIKTINNDDKKAEAGNVKVEINNLLIKVSVKNQKIDLALKKMITDVKDANGNDKSSIIAENKKSSRNNDEVDTSNLMNWTNAEYYMNKVPVDVSIGDTIEYTLKVFNEGAIDARAAQIKDYIPSGLELKKVTYKGQDIEYNYDAQSQVLTIDLNQADFINKLVWSNDEGEYILSKDDNLKVYCQVKEGATGVLTNVAEISKYEIKYDDGLVVEVDKDIDSTSNNWQYPNDDVNGNVDNTDDWRNYGDEDSFGKEHFVQDEGLNSNKGDDDDFEKVRVITKYDFRIKKVKAGTGENISDIKFNVKENDKETVNDIEIGENNQIQYTGEIEPQGEGSIKYEISEQVNPEYVQLDGSAKVEIKTVDGKFDSYKFTYESVDFAPVTNNWVKDNGTVTYKCKNKNGIDLNVKVTFNKEKALVEVVIENTIINSANYQIQLEKVSTDNPDTKIPGVTFGVTKEGEATAKHLVTENDGLTNPEELAGTITLDNYKTSDKYLIDEIDVGDANRANYDPIDNLNINIEVEKENKYNNLGVKQFIITTEQKVKSSPEQNNRRVVVANNNNETKDINIFAPGGYRYTIKATVIQENGVARLKLIVPNAPTKSIPLELVKVDKATGELIQGSTSVKIEKKVSDNETSTIYDNTIVNGSLNLDDKIEGSRQQITYRIYETQPAPEYENIFAGKFIELNVSILNNELNTVVAKLFNAENNTEITDADILEYFDVEIKTNAETGKKYIAIKLNNDKIIEEPIDLALKKVICEVDGRQVKAENGFNAIYDRLTEGDDKLRINTAPLKNGDHDAEYYLNKTPVVVQKGSTVKYQIRIYNEGKVDATASEIYDYLPNGVSLVDVYYKDNEKLTAGKDYAYNKDTNTLKINVLNSKSLIAKFDAEANGNGLSMDYITVECKVEDSAFGYLTNVAEISKYKKQKNDGTIEVSYDIDSIAGNWENRVDKRVDLKINGNNVNRDDSFWTNYSGYRAGLYTEEIGKYWKENIGTQEEPIYTYRGNVNKIEQGKFKDYVGEQDDDDFERLYVPNIDLVLKKIITHIGDMPESAFNSTYQRFQDVDGNRNVNVDVRGLTRVPGVTTANYMLNKTPIIVKSGDIVTYQIRIYNEGKADATASKIIDYIPKGMEFVGVYYHDDAGVEIPLTSGYIYNEETNNLEITALNANTVGKYIPAFTGTNIDLKAPSYDYVIVKCKVTGDVTGLLTNVAEIAEYQTEYGTLTADGTDSQTTGDGEWQAPDGSSKSTKEGKSGDSWADYAGHEGNSIENGKFIDYPGQQDDDDFEKVYVLGGYNVKLRKISRHNNQGLENVTFDINGTEYTTDENGYIDLGNKLFNDIGIETFSIKEKSGVGNYKVLDKNINIGLERTPDSLGGIKLNGYYISYTNDGFSPYKSIYNRLNNLPNERTYTFTTSEIPEDATNMFNYNYKFNVTVKVSKDNNVEIIVENALNKSEYDLLINKKDSKGNNLDGVKFKVNGNNMYNQTDAVVTTEDGKAYVGRYQITENNYQNKDSFRVVEIETPDKYYKLKDELRLEVEKGINSETLEYDITGIKLTSGNANTDSYKESEVGSLGETITIDNVSLESSDETVSVSATVTKVIDENTGKAVPTITITVENKEKKFDLALRKFITEVRNENNTTSINRWSKPAIETEELINNKDVTTATYNNDKTPVEVEKGDTIKYAISVFNEGEIDGYAKLVMDDVPSGLEMISSEKSEINKQYRWKMYRSMKNNESIDTSEVEVIDYKGAKYVETQNASEAKVIVTDYLSKEQGEERKDLSFSDENPNLLKAYNKSGEPYHLEVYVEYKVKDSAQTGVILENDAQIQQHTDIDGNEITLIDEDSTPGAWKEKDDDQDIEQVIVREEVIKHYDLALRKFITKVNDEAIAESREPIYNYTDFMNGDSTTVEKKHSKDPVLVEQKDIVEYTLRIYNEGPNDAYAEMVIDDIPEGTEVIAPKYDESGKPLNLNAEYGWIMFRKISEEELNGLTEIGTNVLISYDNEYYISTDKPEEAVIIGTNYLAYRNGSQNLLKAFNKELGKFTKDNYKDVKVQYRVKEVEEVDEDRILTNYAQIFDFSDDEGNLIDGKEIDLKDEDSTPGKWIKDEDDQDIENLRLVKDKHFDLALRKYITKVNDKEISESREPVVDASKLAKGEATTATYTHPKEESPVLVQPEDVVEYTIRIYNEGEVDGYAQLVMDDIPEGAKMIAPEYTSDGKANNLNAEYRWVMYRKVRKDEDVKDKKTITYDNNEYVVVDKIEDAEVIITDYLSMEMGQNATTSADKENPNLLKAFNKELGKFTEDNYRDIKVQFTITNKDATKLIFNHAQITDDCDGEGNDVIDRDSTPNKWENYPRNDDQDYDVVKTGYFDLALYKWVTTAIVNDGKTIKEYDSKHTQDDKSNVVNVSIPKDKLNSVNVKFRYKIKVENEGTIAGEALEIKEHIPDGLKFIPEDNTEFGWTELDSKTVVTDYLKDTTLEPGEAAEVTIVLTWVNGATNFGEKVNFAEISRDHNDKGWSDIDSTPNNFKDTPKEDDEDKDSVLLHIRTGIENKGFLIIGIVVMAIIAGGVIGIKKFVINK